MKQSEKSRLSKQRILKAALIEFSQFPFEKASISAMCEKSGLAKGLVYHNFGGKDEIYLACVAEAFSALNNQLQTHVQLFTEDSESVVKAYFSTRYRFFTENPVLKKIFYSAMFQPPAHLKDSVAKLHRELGETNDAILSGILPMICLRSEINLKEAKEYINYFVEFYDMYFKKKYLFMDEWDSNVELYELYGQKAIGFLLYGLAGKK